MARKIGIYRNHDNGIKIHFQLHKRKYIFCPVPGGEFNNPHDMATAEAVANQISIDMSRGEFDPSLVKYKPRFYEKGKSPGFNGKWIDLWADYVQFQTPRKSISTVKIDYERVSRALSCAGAIGAYEPVAVTKWIEGNRSPKSAQKIIQQLSACGKWAINNKTIQENPFEGLAKNFKISSHSDEEKPDPFELEERDRIIEHFKSTSHLIWYAPMVEFMFLTGCRPSEVLPLTWADVKHGVICFNKAHVHGVGGKQGLKTQRRRDIRQSEKMKQLLAELRRNRPPANEKNLLFPSKEKKSVLDLRNFRERTWKGALAALDIRYRKPYCTRATFITLALRNGVPIKDVADLVGNSPQTILKHYAGTVKVLTFPEF